MKPFALRDFAEPTRLEAEGTLPMAVYGTLRFGQSNFSWAQEGVLFIVRNVVFPGRLYYVHGRQGFPVAKLDEPGLIHGDILFFDREHPETQAVWDMESGAGYSIKGIEAQDSEGNDWNALAWHYDWSPRGQLIESGNWVEDRSR